MSFRSAQHFPDLPYKPLVLVQGSALLNARGRKPIPARRSDYGRIGGNNVEMSVTSFSCLCASLQASSPDRPPGGPGAPPAPALPPGMSARTDTVLVIASSVSENVGGTPQTVRWNLRLGVSDVDGKLLISRLDSMR